MITGGCALGPARVEQEYERAGALALLAALDVRTEHVFAATTGIAPFMTLMTQVMSHETYHRALRVFVIVDNGSDHRGAKAIRRLGCLPERSIHINSLSTANAALATFKIADQNGGSVRASAGEGLLRTVTRFQARRRADRRL